MRGPSRRQHSSACVQAARVVQRPYVGAHHDLERNVDGLHSRGPHKRVDATAQAIDHPVRMASKNTGPGEGVSMVPCPTAVAS